MDSRPARPAPTATLPRVCVRHIDATGTWWGLRGRHVLRGVGPTFAEVSAFPRMAVDLPSKVRPLERLLRTDQAAIWPTRAGRLLGVRLGVAWDLSDPRAPRRLFEVQGRAPLHGGIAEDRDGNIFFGEYSTNADRHAVRLFRVAPDLRAHEVVHTFPAGRIKHVHTVRTDPHTGQIWVATGDFEDECYLYAFEDDFSAHVVHGDGTQGWRAIALFLTPDHVVWCTDSELETNHVRRMDRRTGELEQGQAFPAPVYQGVRTTDGLYLCCSTAERGPAVRTDQAQVWVSADAWSWSPALSWPRDRLSGLYFRWGILSLPTGSWSSDRSWVHGLAVQGLDDRSCCFDLSHHRRP